MNSKMDSQWQELFEAAMTEVAKWREEHLGATFREIEDELDRRLAQVRAQLLQDLVHRSPKADLRGRPAKERPVCSKCGEPLAANGQHRRELTTNYEQKVAITRSYGRCPECGSGFFPLG